MTSRIARVDLDQLDEDLTFQLAGGVTLGRQRRSEEGGNEGETTCNRAAHETYL
jgi:hypothetical protein